MKENKINKIYPELCKLQKTHPNFSYINQFFNQKKKARSLIRILISKNISKNKLGHGYELKPKEFLKFIKN